MTSGVLEEIKKRPQSNRAQIVSAVTSTIAIIFGCYSLWIAYSNYVDTQAIAISNYKAAQLRETERRVRDTYTKLYDKDVEIWKAVVDYPIIHALIFQDSEGLLYEELDRDSKHRASCVFQILADLFEYYFLIKSDLTSPEWDERNNCWSDYFYYTVGNSYGFRKYITKYEKEWTNEFKTQFNLVLFTKPIPEFPLDIHFAMKNDFTSNNASVSDVQSEAKIESVSNDNTGYPSDIQRKKGNSPEVEKNGWINFLWDCIPFAALIGAVIAIFNTNRRISIQRKIETAKILTEINKATISNKMLSLYWDKYRTYQIYNFLRGRKIDHKESDTKPEDKNSREHSSLGMFPGVNDIANTLEPEDYFTIRNFAYFKLNLFELTHDSMTEGLQSGSWKGFLMYSLKHSAFMREIATDPKKHEFYSNSFCSLLDSCVKRLFIECISRRLILKDSLFPSEVTEHLKSLSGASGKSLFDSYTELVQDEQKIEDLQKCCEAYWRLHDSMPSSLLSIGSLRLRREMQRITEKEYVKFLFLVFEEILSLENRWKRHGLMDSICASVNDFDEFAGPSGIIVGDGTLAGERSPQQCKTKSLTNIFLD